MLDLNNRPTGQRITWGPTCTGTVVGHTPEGYLVERADDNTVEHIKHHQVEEQHD